MVRKNVRTGVLLFKKNSKGKEKGKTFNLTFPTKSHGKEKGKNWFLTFQKKKKKILRVRKKVRTQILLFQKITW